MKVVYVLFGPVSAYDCPREFEAVFENKEDAEKVCDYFNKRVMNYHTKNDCYEVEEWELHQSVPFKEYINLKEFLDEQNK